MGDWASSVPLISHDREGPGGQSGSAGMTAGAKAVIAGLFVLVTAAVALSAVSVVMVLKVKGFFDKDGHVKLSNTSLPAPAQTPWPLQTPYPLSEPLPTAYAVPEIYHLPPTDQDGLGTCWAFSTVHLLESQYRAQGIRAGYLSPDDYVKFSVQAYFTYLAKKICNDTAGKVPRACFYGGLRHGTSEDQEIEAIYYFRRDFPQLGDSILPDTVCPYNYYSGQMDFDYFNCSGMDAALPYNPIHWDVKSVTMAYSVDQIKQLLFQKKRTLAIGTPLSDLIYYPPCTEAPWNLTDVCQSQLIPCPDQEGEFCYKFVLDGRSQDGVFMGERDTRKMGELGGHAMNVVGYSDSWLHHERFQSQSGVDEAPQLKGGFILHNSWTGQRGHSIQYLLGNQSEENENVLCPNYISPDSWIPGSADCIRNHWQNISDAWKYGNIPIFKCEGEPLIQRVRGANPPWFTPDVLKCHSSVCNQSDGVYYVLGKSSPAAGDVDVQYLPDGLHSVRVIKLDLSAAPPVVTEERIARVPFWSLSQVFRPVNLTAFPNNDDYCGYWMLPYEVMENMKRINWDLLDNFRVFDMEIEFSASSYLHGPPAAGKKYELLAASTHNFTRVPFDGPLPFDKIYKDAQ